MFNNTQSFLFVSLNNNNKKLKFTNTFGNLCMLIALNSFQIRLLITFDENTQFIFAVVRVLASKKYFRVYRFSGSLFNFNASKICNFNSKLKETAS